jgi:hypothetical protein
MCRWHGSDEEEEIAPSALHVVAAARAELLGIYGRAAPEKVRHVDKLLVRFAGIELEFVEEMRLKYLPLLEPPLPAGSAGGSASTADGSPQRSINTEAAADTEGESDEEGGSVQQEGEGEGVRICWEDLDRPIGTAPS